MSTKESFKQAIGNLEIAMATALRAVTETGTPQQIENFTKLMIKKEVIMHTLLGEILEEKTK